MTPVFTDCWSVSFWFRDVSCSQLHGQLPTYKTFEIENNDFVEQLNIVSE